VGVPTAVPRPAAVGWRVSVAAAVAVAGCVCAPVVGPGRPAMWAWPTLAAGIALTDLAAVRFGFGRHRYVFSLSAAAIGAALTLATGGWLVPAVTAGRLVALIVRRTPLPNILINAGTTVAATAAAVGVAEGAGGAVAGAVAGMAAFWLVTTGFRALAAARRMPWSDTPLGLLLGAGTAGIGVLGGWLAVHAPVGLVGLALPVVLLLLAYDAQAARAAETHLFAELVRGQDHAGGRSTDDSAAIVLAAAARLFRGDADLVAIGPDGPVRFTATPDGPVRRRSDPRAFDQPWVTAALGGGRVETGVADHRPVCIAVLGRPAGAAAVLRVQRPAGASPFGRREATLAGLLAGQAESWLSAAAATTAQAQAQAEAAAAADQARALGDLGAHTAPALGLLHESAARLARLASRPGGADQVNEIVDELHAVERAVASLLGAIVLAADAAGPVAHPGRAGSRRRDEWTSTGVLGGAG
jgi:hypothetical protein